MRNMANIRKCCGKMVQKYSSFVRFRGTIADGSSEYLYPPETDLSTKGTLGVCVCVCVCVAQRQKTAEKS
eukprot:3501850-Amphidinium_carterae.1